MQASSFRDEGFSGRESKLAVDRPGSAFSHPNSTLACEKDCVGTRLAVTGGTSDSSVSFTVSFKTYIVGRSEALSLD